MGRENWHIMIQSKSFYVRTYRACLTGIAVSVLLNLVLGLVIDYLYFHQPHRDFYATSGIISPIKLNALKTPNYSSTPLLDEERSEENTAKVIPQ
ncbi:MAG: type IVB secretion system protein IcmM/DotJ [Tatlockia sp.]|jgi:intracellular multiplication protein IcmM